MARKLIVEVVGDTSNLERSFRRGSKAAAGFNKEMTNVGRTTRGAVAGLGGVGGLLARASAGFLGFYAAGKGLRAAFAELSEQVKVQAQTEAALKSTGAAAGVSAEQIDELSTSLMNLTGIDDEVIKQGQNVLLTFTRIRNEVGDGNDIFRQATEAALDLATRFGGDARKAFVQVGKALNDPVRGVTALRRVGISFTKQQQVQIKTLVESGRVLEAQKLILRELQIEVGGTAAAVGATLPGKLAILEQNVLNLAAAIAELLTPSLTAAADAALQWIQRSENQAQVMSDARAVVGGLRDVFVALRGVLRELNDVTGSTRNTVKLLLGVFIAFKTAKLISSFANIATSVGLVGGSAETATAQVVALRRVLTLLVRGSPYIATALIAYETYKNPRSIIDRARFIRDAITGPLNDALGGVPTVGFIEYAAPLIKALEKTGKKTGQAFGKGLTEGMNEGISQAIADSPRLEAAVARSQQPLAVTTPPPEVARFSTMTPWLDYLKAVAESTKSMLDDLRVVRQVIAVLSARLKLAKNLKDITALQEAVNKYRDEERAILKGISDARKEAAAARREAAIARREAAARQAARQRARDQARQFRALGLGPTGGELVPNVESLKKTANRIGGAIKGTLLDTKKNRSLLRTIGRILRGELGRVTNDVRAWIDDFFDTVNDGLKEQGAKTALRFRKVSTDSFVSSLGLGLSGEQKRKLAFALAGLGPNLTAQPRSTPAYAGAAGVTVNGDVHIHGVANWRQMEEQARKRAKSRPQVRRGARG